MTPTTPSLSPLSRRTVLRAISSCGVLGMDTAGGTAGYAIPINTVISTAHRLDTPHHSRRRVRPPGAAPRRPAMTRSPCARSSPSDDRVAIRAGISHAQPPATNQWLGV